MVAGNRRWSNAAATTLNGAINSSTLTIVATDASTHPATGEYTIRIDNELIPIASRSSNTLTATSRGAEGSAAASHSDGAALSHVVTGADLDELYLPTDRPPWNPRAMAFIKDDWQAQANGKWGDNNWKVLAGTGSIVSSEAGHPGIGRLATGTSANDSTRATLGEGSHSAVDADDTWEVVFVARPNAVDSDVNVEFGLVDNGGFSTLTEGPNSVLISKGWGQTTWRYSVRKADTQTTDDSGITATAAWHWFRIRRKGSLIYFTVDGNAETAISVGTNIPIVGLQPAIGLRTQAATSKTVDLDYCHLLVTGLSR